MSPSESKDRNDQVVSTVSVRAGLKKVERREWWLWLSAVAVTLLLTAGLVSFVVPMIHHTDGAGDGLQLAHAVRGLVGLVLLFDIYVVYQQLQIYRIRQRLVESEELFRLITENAADMIAVIDGSGRRLYNSPAYERLLGYSREELHDSSPMEQIHPEDRPLVAEATKEARCTGVGRRIEYRMRHKDGTWRILESTASSVLNTDGKVERLVIVNRDITSRKRLEEQFRQSQKMEAVGRLSGGIAHDFNNILGVIIGYSEILQERMVQSEALRPCVEEILQAGRRAASLTRQLLAFSRQQVLAPVVLDLNATITDTEKMLRRLIGEDIELQTSLEQDLAYVKADQSQIEQVILNLAVNARDAMPNGGRLTIVTENAELDEMSVRRYSYPVKPGRYVLLTVSDTGVGMSREIQGHIFEPFFTTKEKGKGTGLGLATVYGVVKQSDGYIELQSELGEGTTFKIYLPRVERGAAPETRKVLPAPLLAGHETILLVEDEDSLRNLTSGVLVSLGYTVLTASNGSRALETSQAHSGEIALLLTDVVMPNMNGPALAEQLTAERPNLKVLYMSGYTGQRFGEGVLPDGSCFLAKPFSRENLAQKVREALEGTAKDLSKEAHA